MKIIFTHIKPEFWQYKTASALRKKGVKTISISLIEFDKKKYKNAFDEIISPELPNLKPKTLLNHFFKNPVKILKFLFKILAIKADAAICQGAPHYLTAFFIWLFKGRFPRIYFPYDINSSRFRNLKSYFPKREIWGEEYSFKNCDAINVKSQKQELELLPESFNIKNKPKSEFQCYVMPEWSVPYQPEKLSSKDKQIHIVYTGIFMDEPDSFHKSMLPDFQEILKQKMHLHIYCAYNSLTKEQYFKITKNDKRLMPFFHVHQFVSPEKLSSEISKYDFGYYFVEYNKNAVPKSVKFVTGNKVSSYFESAIPVIVYKGNLINSKMIEENNIGISIEKMKNLKKEIKKFNYNKSIKSLLEFRKKYSAYNHINELIDFMKSLN